MTALYHGTENLPATAQGSVLTIGNFDGIHMGHRALIKKAQALAVQEKTPLGVVTFEPHPRQFFQPQAEPFRLTLLPMKQRLLKTMGVDHFFAVPFNKELSLLGGEEFIDRILVRDLKARHIVVGEDFAFGRGRTGTVGTLRACGKFKVTTISPATSADGRIYSSTAVRELLQQKKFQEAEKLLGWPWALEAPVIHGDKRGRTLGFPTANQSLPAEYLRLPYGIYAVRVQITEETVWRDAVSSFGIRPMFQRPQPVFETFIFDYVEEIYGKMLRVQPVRFLRPELSFPDTAALTAQMKEDCIAAKAVLKSTQLL